MTDEEIRERQVLTFKMLNEWLAIIATIGSNIKYTLYMLVFGQIAIIALLISIGFVLLRGVE